MSNNEKKGGLPLEPYENALYEMLVDISRALDRIEMQWLRQSKDFDLTMSDIHLLYAVGPAEKKSRDDVPGNTPGGGKTISELSKILHIRLPSVTLAVNKLVQKGYLEKVKDDADKRVVYVRLTRLGLKAEHAHRYFHRNMTRSITGEMSDEEQSVLLSGLGKLYNYFMSTLPDTADEA